MYFFYRKTDKTKCLTGHGRVYIASQWANPERVITPLEIKDAAGNIIKLEAGDIVQNEGGQASDYAYLDIPHQDSFRGINLAKEILFTLDAQGEPIGIAEWHSAIEQTGPMRLTVSNGDYGGRVLDLPLADRQVNIVADSVYDIIVEISVIRNDTTGAMDIAYCTNDAALAAGWSRVHTLLKGVVPAGTTNLVDLGLV